MLNWKKKLLSESTWRFETKSQPLQWESRQRERDRLAICQSSGFEIRYGQVSVLFKISNEILCFQPGACAMAFGEKLAILSGTKRDSCLPSSSRVVDVAPRHRVVNWFKNNEAKRFCPLPLARRKLHQVRKFSYNISFSAVTGSQRVAGYGEFFGKNDII